MAESVPGLLSNADSAYPAQCRPGIETIAADERHTVVLERVFAILGQSRHISPTIYTDQELSLVTEEDAPGVTCYREKLRSVLPQYYAYTFRHEEIISMLDRAGEKLSGPLD